MALSERSFGPSGGGPWVYLDTSQSEVIDATAGDAALFIPGEEFILEASYERLGSDLLLSGEGHSVFVQGYSTHKKRHKYNIQTGCDASGDQPPIRKTAEQHWV